MTRYLEILKAYLRGVKEFRRSLSAHYNDYGLMLAYDRGRELAHRLTFRKYDE